MYLYLQYFLQYILSEVLKITARPPQLYDTKDLTAGGSLARAGSFCHVILYGSLSRVLKFVRNVRVLLLRLRRRVVQLRELLLEFFDFVLGLY